MDTIRSATEVDAAAIAHVHVESWRTTYGGVVPDGYLAGLDETARAANWREWIGLGTPVFVAMLDGLVVGFISGGAIREPVDGFGFGFDAELYTIYLLQQAQRRGLGTALLRELAQTLDARGFKSMAVWVLGDNKSSRFYERTGARRVALKEMEVGGVWLPVVAYGWPSLGVILAMK